MGTSYPERAEELAIYIDGERFARGFSPIRFVPLLNECALTLATEYATNDSDDRENKRPDGSYYFSILEEKGYPYQSGSFYAKIVENSYAITTETVSWRCVTAMTEVFSNESNYLHGEYFGGVACYYGTDYNGKNKWYWVFVCISHYLNAGISESMQAYYPAVYGYGGVTISGVDMDGNHFNPASYRLKYTPTRSLSDEGGVFQNGISIPYIDATSSSGQDRYIDLPYGSLLSNEPFQIMGLPYDSYTFQATPLTGYSVKSSGYVKFKVDVYGNPAVTSIQVVYGTYGFDVIATDSVTGELLESVIKIVCNSGTFPEYFTLTRNGRNVPYQIDESRQTITFTTGNTPTRLDKIPQVLYDFITYAQPEDYIKPETITEHYSTIEYAYNGVMDIKTTPRIQGNHPVVCEKPIIVYPLSTPQDSFVGNGLAVLTPTECIEIQNDDLWEVSLTHLIDSTGKWKYLMWENVLKIAGQLFRIDKVKINAYNIQVSASHISHDMAHQLIHDNYFEGGTGQDFIDFCKLKSKVDLEESFYPEYEFTGTSDITEQIDGDKYFNTSFLSALIGADNCMLNRYGGELYRDNFYFSINQRMENALDNAFCIRFDMSMSEISMTIDATDVCTKLDSYDNFGNGVSFFYTVEGGQWAFHHHRSSMAKFTYTDESTAMSQLGHDSFALWCTVGTPKVNYSVKFSRIKSDPRYADFLQLQNLRYGDRGRIYCPEISIDTIQQIKEIEIDRITNEVISMQLGNVVDTIVRPAFLGSTVTSGNTLIDKIGG